jgi:hypothetical protein
MPNRPIKISAGTVAHHFETGVAVDLGRLARGQWRAASKAQARIDEQALDQHEHDRGQHEREPEQLTDDGRAI